MDRVANGPKRTRGLPMQRYALCLVPSLVGIAFFATVGAFLPNADIFGKVSAAVGLWTILGIFLHAEQKVASLGTFCVVAEVVSDNGGASVWSYYVERTRDGKRVSESFYDEDDAYAFCANMNEQQGRDRGLSGQSLR